MTDHRLKLRVYYEDTDAAGVVYHAGYLRFAERGRTEMLRDAGFEHARLFRASGTAFAVVSMNIEFKAPARLDDHLEVRTKIIRVGGASMDMQQDIYRDEQLLTTMTVGIVCIDKAFKAVRIPNEIRDMHKKA